MINDRIAATQTITYITRATTDIGPKIKATKSKSNNQTKPRFNHHITNKIKNIQFNAFMVEKNIKQYINNYLITLTQ